METTSTNTWKQALRAGLLGGLASILMALIGMVVSFDSRDIISNAISMGQILLLSPIILLSYHTVRGANLKLSQSLLLGGLVGLAGGVVIDLLLTLGNLVNLRAVLINASPELYRLLTLGIGFPAGLAVPLAAGLISGLAAAGVSSMEPKLRNATIQAILWTVMIGLLRDLLVTIVTRWGFLSYVFLWIFANSGLTVFGALVVFVLVGGVTYYRSIRPVKEKVVRTPTQQKLYRTVSFVAIGVVLLLLPPVLGIFFSEVLDNVGLYILMGLGLNIVVGFAGLLDLGYVAFYAIGAYTMGVLTSPELGFFNMTFWQALPFALAMTFFSGIVLGLPVLKMRGDYLAIVTLGFGEIVRLLALSDWLRPYLGGTQGIQQIAVPTIGGYSLGSQQHLYYLILIGIGIVGFIAWRLKDSRLGRSWMALREDEDVAMAMGINHVTTKLMAFAVGALFSGLGGTIFAAKLTSAYPHSFNFLVSINILSLVIIGGMGSIPGVFVGALALVGLPELLREFAEYRLLVYGAVLVAMMLIKP
ncbi:MAG: hypothetical protein PHS96_03465, partial [Anaerolineales bacterium]|nr:hypothetical protein [Anaerolineales bacterium]